MTSDLTAADTHFEFGKNWSDYADLIDSDAIEKAEQGVLALIPQERLVGASWLDIGSGSGLHSLAAHRLGAASITAFDIDADSVATTRRVLEAHQVDAHIEQRSIFDMAGVGQFDIVYSWGVLHHTGAMWPAIDAASRHVKPGGLFALALYQKTASCAAWKVEKRLYSSAPKLVQKAARGVFATLFSARQLTLGINPRHYVRDYKATRGMNYWHDVHDWLGGYPYESAGIAETTAFVSKLGFMTVKTLPLPTTSGLFGTGCAEFVFQKNP